MSGEREDGKTRRPLPATKLSVALFFDGFPGCAIQCNDKTGRFQFFVMVFMADSEFAHNSTVLHRVLVPDRWAPRYRFHVDLSHLFVGLTCRLSIIRRSAQAGSGGVAIEADGHCSPKALFSMVIDTLCLHRRRQACSLYNISIPKGAM